MCLKLDKMALEKSTINATKLLGTLKIFMTNAFHPDKKCFQKCQWIILSAPHSPQSVNKMWVWLSRMKNCRQKECNVREISLAADVCVFCSPRGVVNIQMARAKWGEKRSRRLWYSDIFTQCKQIEFLRVWAGQFFAHAQRGWSGGRGARVRWRVIDCGSNPEVRAGPLAPSASHQSRSSPVKKNGLFALWHRKDCWLRTREKHSDWLLR